uniref:NADH-ubiquinone oxidoreductase chain 4 n=1 Tax=Pomphorhynchus rocci TaxID=1183240 RepID=A0A806GX32_9BILA|nr:NADH dehydrogenase subunit 4 [Pomphorhynchus rocci]AFJ54214.1 NADH dehydrogenase subunit 4 [Pomphorhynchus rocci]
MGGLLFFFEQVGLMFSFFLWGVYFVLFGVFGGGFDYSVWNLEVGFVGVGMLFLVGVIMMSLVVWASGGGMGGGLLIMSMGAVMVGFFVVDSWLWFYIMYEGVVLPLVLVVLVLGAYYERVSSCLYLLIYTVLFSTPLLVGVLVGVSLGELIWVSWWGYSMSGVWGAWGFIISLAMLVKIPIYGLHGWLPKVHVEAPTWGSIVLAGVVIKLGLYGLFVLSNSGLLGSTFWGVGVWAMIGGCLAGLYCLVVGDVKALVAYSSVVHMSGVVWLFSFGGSGVWRGFLLVALMHGLVSATFFGCVGYLGESLKSRSVSVFKGVVSFYSGMGLLMVIILVFNMGFPISGGFLGELEVFWVLLCLYPLGVFLVGVYMLVGCGFNLGLGVVMSGGHSHVIVGLKESLVMWGLLGLSVLYLGASSILL